MKTILALLFLVVGTVVNGQDWRPDDALLDAIRQVESSGGKFLYGDGGRSLGDFQMGRAAWTDVNRWRKARQLKVYSYNTAVFQPVVSREYAANYLSILRDGLMKKIDREPTASELYAAYNIGLSKFGKQCRYDIRRVNATTARKCREIEAMIARAETQVASVR